jgi:hypothetical protein
VDAVVVVVVVVVDDVFPIIAVMTLLLPPSDRDRTSDIARCRSTVVQYSSDNVDTVLMSILFCVPMTPMMTMVKVLAAFEKIRVNGVIFLGNVRVWVFL